MPCKFVTENLTGKLGHLDSPALIIVALTSLQRSVLKLGSGIFTLKSLSIVTSPTATSLVIFSVPLKTI